jgi:hypothetical protein
MKAESLERPTVTFDGEQQPNMDLDAPMVCSVPVGNTTFEFEVHFADMLAQLAADREDAIDLAIINSRRGEPVESMEKVFSELGIA